MSLADYKLVYRLYDVTTAELIQPSWAYCIAGKVNRANRVNLVIDSFHTVTKPAESSIVLLSLPAREGHLPDVSQMAAAIPLPLQPEDRLAGCYWSLSIWQMEVSLTRLFDRPCAGVSSSKRSATIWN